MPPKKRPAGDDANGDEPRKRPAAATSTAAPKSVTISAPGTATAAKPATTAARSSTTSKTGTVRGAPKPGIRKVGAAALASRSRLPIAGSSTLKKEAPPPIITKNTLMWFRNDLRLRDNKALHAASLRAKLGDEKCLIGLFIISEAEWASHDEAPVKIDFWMRNLAMLKKSLDKLHIPLVIKRASSASNVVGIVESTVKEMDISHVYWNVEYMVDEMKRDAAVKKALEKLPGIYVEQHHDQGVIPPREMADKTGGGYTSFEPFNSTWNTRVETKPHYLQLSASPEANPIEAKQLYAEHFNSMIPSLHSHTLERVETEHLYPAGEEVAHERLRIFIEEKIKRYHLSRDCPHEEGGASLAPYLSSGVLSARQCVAAARAANNNKIIIGNEGVRTWIRELVWMEFYRHVLVYFPRVCKNHAFKPIMESIRWSTDDRKFQMWCQGKTGYPIVDAGMRQLNTTGYMHNRVRMVTACFLVKDLLINWQKGEKYFMGHLIDGDFASNNGSWQWCASTGVESPPFYHAFNPILQSQKFDPNGDYIRQWVPELKSLSDKQIHDPYHTMSAKEFGKLAYPKPIVDHAEAKKRFLEEYKRILVPK
ncbi:hypothetical protein BGZ80_009801 [Entomortierella chlamydospora]|uniref:Photolyase/cryptochrome alpha/beta domain-containing protein n=1 Tax=Entomortierella chlamydospora TaxID=101097 RepID=A0A9P6N4I0_9FUNG|nr:hypothetical protein BGZ79_003255 [Entomortierella chlamydospora]KAG0023307.1 hypothetical protein BGZ80_009801 [Entomortierella chlamydospora]